MSLFVWNPKYAVGHSEIDSQHKQLFEMANDLHAAMLEGKGKDALAGLFSRLVTYTRHHFSCEESIMRQNGYPGFMQHQLEHQKLTQQVLDLQKKIALGKGVLTLDAMQFLSDWLRNHIQISDQKVATHIKKRNGVPARA